MVGARAVVAVGRGWGSSNAGSAGRRSRVRVDIRCSPCRPRSMGDPVARGVRGQALSPLRLPSFGRLPGSATRCCRGCRCGGPVYQPHPGHTGRGTSAARPRRRAAGGGTAPDTRRPSQWWQVTPPGEGPRHPRGTQPPRGMQAKGTVLGCRGPLPTCCGRGCAGVWGPSTVPFACVPCGGCVSRGRWGAIPRGGGLPPLRGASGVRRCPSLGRPSSGVGSRGSAIRVSRVRLVGRGDPARAPQRAPLRASAARCEAGGRASPGGYLPSL